MGSKSGGSQMQQQGQLPAQGQQPQQPPAQNAGQFQAPPASNYQPNPEAMGAYQRALGMPQQPIPYQTAQQSSAMSGGIAPNMSGQNPWPNSMSDAKAFSDWQFQKNNPGIPLWANDMLSTPDVNSPEYKNWLATRNQPPASMPPQQQFRPPVSNYQPNPQAMGAYQRALGMPQPFQSQASNYQPNPEAMDAYRNALGMGQPQQQFGNYPPQLQALMRFLPMMGMRRFAKGGSVKSDDTDKPRTIPRKMWEPIHGLKITPPAEEESKDPDIREYQNQRYRHEFEGGPEPQVVPRRPVKVESPFMGRTYELGSVPYNYAPAASMAAQAIYGQKTLPLYFNPATAPFARAVDAYETAKRIKDQPTNPMSYVGIPGTIMGAGRIAAGAVGAGAAGGMLAQEEARAPQQSAVDRSKSPVFRQGGDEMDAMRLANGITNPDYFSQMINRGKENVPMRHAYGTRHGSDDLKDIGFKGPIENDGHQVTEYSVDRDYQYPSIYSGISKPDLQTVLSAERFGQNTPEDVDQRAYGAAQQRVEQGRSPFYEPGKDEYPAWSPDQNWEQPAVMRGAGGEIVKKALKAVSRADTPLGKAAQGIGGDTTREAYQALINEHKPVRAYESVPTPATTEDLYRALHANKREKIGMGANIPEGAPVGLRLDIPAYTEHGVWAPTIHDTANNNRVLAHEPAARVTNPVFVLPENKALKVAQGAAKSPFATINGQWAPTPVEDIHASAQEYLNHPDWRQVGMDPERHSYFYDRATQEPITQAEEALQVGPLVLAKNPVYGKREDFKYANGGKANSILDKNPQWRMSLEEGGVPNEGGQQQFLQEQLKGSAPQYVEQHDFPSYVEPSRAEAGPISEALKIAAKAAPSVERSISRYREPASQYISDWKWRPLKDVQREVGTTQVPEHVQNFGNYMDQISDKAATEGLDPEDAIKAYMITRSSIQREGRTPQKLASYGIPVRETSEGIVRPEGHMADFLTSPMGVRFLNEARRGELSQDVVDAAQAHMRPFGMSSTEPNAMDWARRNIPEQTKTISDLVARARSGESSPEAWRGFTAGVKGIGPAKAGFLGSLLGRGDLPTLDARQAILHTGLKNAEAQKIMQKKSGRAGHEAVDRLAARQRAMNFELPEYLQPYYQHLAHHTVWDTVGNERTTHQDIIDAMKPRASGGQVVSDALRIAREGLRGGGRPHVSGPRLSSGEVVGWTPEKEAMSYDLEQKYGLPEGTMRGMSYRESQFGKLPNRPGSQYQSEFQLGKHLRGDVSNTRDFAQTAEAAAKYAAENQASLQSRLGRAPTREELYMGHQQGDKGAAKLITHPGASAASQIGSKFANANAGRGLTSQQFIDKHSQAFNQGIQKGAEQLWNAKGATPQLGDTAMMQGTGATPEAMQMAGLQGPTNVPKGVPSTMMAQATGAPSMPQQVPTQMAKAETTTPSAPTPTTPPAKPTQMAAEINIGKPPQMEMPKAPDNVSAGPAAQLGAPDETSSQNFLASQDIGVPQQAEMPEAPAAEMPDMTAGMESMFMARGGLVDHALKIAHDAMNKGGGAWTRKEGKNPNGGLNAKGRASLKAQGHDIKPPQPEGGSRKDSFCARMSGMKKKLTSSETANDPNSRINKSLRAWNCHADGGPVWDKPRPKGLGKPKELSSSQKASAKASAKAAGRPYPNLVDNMRAAKK